MECAPTKSSGTLTPHSEPEPTPELAFKNLLTWALKGHDEYDLREALEATFPQYSADDLLARAADHFQKAGQADPDHIRGFCIEAYRELYRRALAIGDLSTALKALAKLEQTASNVPDQEWEDDAPAVDESKGAA